MEKITPKKALLIVAAVIFIGGILAAGIAYFMSTQPVVATIHDGVTVDIYVAKAGKGTDHEDRAVAAASGTKSIRLKENRTYVAVSRASGDYAATPHRFEVGDKKANFELKPTFTDEKLSSLLITEKAAIDKAIVAISPKLTSLYRISPGKLFAQGEWYGTTLVYKGPATTANDTLRLVAHKENGIWTIVAKPQLVISSAINNSIPLTISQAVNKL